jgi:hypothetical protein
MVSRMAFELLDSRLIPPPPFPRCAVAESRLRAAVRRNPPACLHTLSIVSPSRGSPTFNVNADGQARDSLHSNPPDAFTMNKLANMLHWSERMGPGFGMKPQPPNNPMGLPSMTPQQQQQQKTAHGVSPIMPPSPADAPIYYTFNVPFSSDLAGPDTEDILYATAGAVLRWTHPEDAPDDVPVYELPVHANNIVNLRKLCNDLTNGPRPIEAHVKSSEPKRVKGQVTTVCLSGSPDLVHESREAILNETPLALVSSERPGVEGYKC